MVFSRDEPLFLEWRYLPRLLPFLAKFLSFARAVHVAHCACSLSYLLSDSHAQHQSLAEVTEQSALSVKRISVLVTPQRRVTSQMSQAVCCAVRMAMRLRGSMGRLMRIRDPLYSGQCAKVVCYKNSGRISDPGAYLAALLARFQAEGGTMLVAKLKISSCRMEPIRP